MRKLQYSKSNGRDGLLSPTRKKTCRDGHFDNKLPMQLVL